MSEILVIDGIVRHRRSVPSLDQTGSFLQEFSSRNIEENRSSHIEK